MPYLAEGACLALGALIYTVSFVNLGKEGLLNSVDEDFPSV